MSSAVAYQPTDIVYGYDAVPTVKAFSRSDKFIRGLMGPFGSGKSSGCVIELVKIAKRQPLMADGKRRSRFAVVRNTYRQLEDTTIKTVHDWLPPHDFGKYNKTDKVYVIDRLDKEIEIELLYRALDRPEHVSNLLSLELTGAWVNEAREIPEPVIKALKGRVGRYPAVKDGGCVDPGIFMDTNPPDDESWWYKMFEEDPADNVALFKQPAGDGPDAENLKYLPPNYYENLSEGEEDEFIKVYVRGEYGFVKDGKPVYPNYNDNLHCKRFDINPKGVVKRGWDFGLTPSCVFSQVSPKGKWMIFDELVSEDLGIDTFSDSVLLHCAEKYPDVEWEDYGDPAGSTKAETDERTCFEILRGKQILIQPGEQTPTIRIESVKKPMNTLVDGGSQFMLHPRCKVLRKGFQGRYQYKKIKVAGAAERFHDKPDKNEYSHPHDALQYVATKIFGNAVRSRDRTKRKRPQVRQQGIV